MKKMLLLTILGLSTITSFLFGETKGIVKADETAVVVQAAETKPSMDGYYPQSGIVVVLDYNTDEVIWEDFNGFQYAFYGIEDWCVGDGVSAIMYDNGTPKVFDDIIIDVNYTAWDMRRW